MNNDFDNENIENNNENLENINNDDKNDIIKNLEDKVFKDINILFKNTLNNEINIFKSFLMDNIKIVKNIKYNNKYYFHLFIIYCKQKYNISIKKYFYNYYGIKYKEHIFLKVKNIYSEDYNIPDIENIYESTLSQFKGFILYLKIIVEKDYNNIIKNLDIFNDGKDEINKIINIFNNDTFLESKILNDLINISMCVILRILLILIKNQILDYKLELLINTSIATFLRCIGIICSRKDKYKEIYYLMFKNNDIKKLLKCKGLLYLFYHSDKIIFIKTRPKTYTFLKFLKTYFTEYNIKY